ncbi:MFS transporter [Weissella diestrammenae]|nr:MFS transporter [Weissella diestrammenae]
MTVSNRTRQIFVVILLATSFIFSISQSAMTTLYPMMSRQFELPVSTIQWLTTGLMLTMTIMMPLSPWLLRRVAFKWLLLSLQAIFIIGTVLALIAPNFMWVMVGRILEGVAVGILFPSFQSVILMMTPETVRGTAMGWVGLVMGSALAVGPIVSGVISQFFAWRAVFGFFLGLLALLLILTWRYGQSLVPLRPNALDCRSIVGLVGIAALLYALQALGQIGINWQLGIILLIGCVLSGDFIWRQYHLKRPLLDLSLLRYRQFRQGLLLNNSAYIALIVMTVLMPLYFQNVLQLAPFWSGLLMVPAAVTLSVLNHYAGRLLDRQGVRIVMRIGACCIVFGFVGLSITFYEHLIILAVIFSIFAEAGNAFMMMPAMTFASDSLTDQRMPDGTAIITTGRQIAGVIGVLLATTLIETNGIGLSGTFICFSALAVIMLGMVWRLV